MKQITVVTTFHKPGLELYGQRFLDSWAEHVHPDIKLKVYTDEYDEYFHAISEAVFKGESIGYEKYENLSDNFSMSSSPLSRMNMGAVL